MVGVYKDIYSLLIYIIKNHVCGISVELSELMHEKGRFADQMAKDYPGFNISHSFRTRN